MGVDVDQAGNYQFACRIDGVGVATEVSTDRGDAAVGDGYVADGVELARGVDDAAAF